MSAHVIVNLGIRLYIKQSEQHDCCSDLFFILRKVNNMINSYDGIKKLNDKLNKYKWACVVDGKLAPNNEDYWEEYRTVPPNVFERLKAGCCWDYCNYQADYFKKNFPGINFSLYYIESDDINEKDSTNHTWMAYFHDGRVYAFESSWKAYKGIHEFESVDEMLDWYAKNQFRNYKKAGYPPYVIYEYERTQKDNLKPEDFMLYIFRYGKLLRNHNGKFEKYVKPLKLAGWKWIYMTTESHVVDNMNKSGDNMDCVTEAKSKEYKIKGQLLYKKLTAEIVRKFGKSCPALKNAKIGLGIKSFVIIKLGGLGRTYREYVGDIAGYITFTSKGVLSRWVNPKAKNFNIDAKLDSFLKKPTIETTNKIFVTEDIDNESYFSDSLSESENIQQGTSVKMSRKMTARKPMKPMNGYHKNIVSNEATYGSDILKKDIKEYKYKQYLDKDDMNARYEDPSKINEPPKNFNNLDDIAGLELKTFKGYLKSNDDIQIIFHSGGDYNCIGYVRCPENGIKLVKQWMADCSTRSERFDYYVKDSKGNGGKFELWFNPKKHHSNEI